LIMKFSMVFVTTKDEAEAELIAEKLLERRLAACCNIIPGVKSLFRWKGVTEKSSEAMLIIKTKRPIALKLAEEIRKLHSYENPAIEVVDISGGSKDSMKWMQDETA